MQTFVSFLLGKPLVFDQLRLTQLCSERQTLHLKLSPRVSKAIFALLSSSTLLIGVRSTTFLYVIGISKNVLAAETHLSFFSYHGTKRKQQPTLFQQNDQHDTKISLQSIIPDDYYYSTIFITTN